MSGGVHDTADTIRRGAGSPGKIGEISLTPRQINLKLAFRDLIEASGGLEAAALFCRLGKSQLHRCCDLKTLDFAPIDVVHALEERTQSSGGWPHVTRHNARVMQLALVPVPGTQHVTSDNVHALLADVTGESNDVIHGVLAALTSGPIGRAQASRLAVECDEAAEAFMRCRTLLEQISGEP